MKGFEGQQLNIPYDKMNSVLANIEPLFSDPKVLRTSIGKRLTVNLYHYALSQVDMFLIKMIHPDRDLNTYLDAKDLLESFLNGGRLKHLNSIVTSYKKVFSWFILDIATLRLKAVTQNDQEHIVDFIPTIPKLMWLESSSESLMNKGLEFDFKENSLKELQSNTFNCIILDSGVVDEFIERCTTGQLDLIKFTTTLILNKFSWIDEWYNLEEIYLSILGENGEAKQRYYAITLLYFYIHNLGLMALIDQRL